MWVSIIFGRVRSTEATHARAKKGKKVSANAVGGASRVRRRETYIQEGLEPEKKVSCLMMSEVARVHVRAVGRGQ